MLCRWRMLCAVSLASQSWSKRASEPFDQDAAGQSQEDNGRAEAGEAPRVGPLSFVLQRRGQDVEWDAYLDAVYGPERDEDSRYPVDIGKLNWLYWAAPLKSAIWLYTRPRADVDGYMSHFSPLGYSLVAGRTNERAVRTKDGGLWMEVMREDKPGNFEDARRGFWYYEARGSGIWIELGRFVDYSCTEPSVDQHLTREDVQPYDAICRRHGLTVYRTDPNTLHLNRHYKPIRGRSILPEEFAQFTRSEHQYGPSHRPRGYETIVRWFGLDLQTNMSTASRREVIDVRQNDSSCGGLPPSTCGGSTNPRKRAYWTRCCTCIGGDTAEIHTNTGWAASGGHCGCEEAFRIHSPGYARSGFLNCGRSSHPHLLRLMRYPLGPADPVGPPSRTTADLAVPPSTAAANATAAASGPSSTPSASPPFPGVGPFPASAAPAAGSMRPSSPFEAMPGYSLRVESLCKGVIRRRRIASLYSLPSRGPGDFYQPGCEWVRFQWPPIPGDKTGAPPKVKPGQSWSDGRTKAAAFIGRTPAKPDRATPRRRPYGEQPPPSPPPPPAFTLSDECRAVQSLVRRPGNRNVAWRYGNSSEAAMAEASIWPAPKRRVFDMIVFGFETELLRLHMHTLSAHVEMFLVSESTLCFQTRKSKPALLTEMLAAGTLHPTFANKTAARVVTEPDALPFCGPLNHSLLGRRYSRRCFQAVQRFMLLELLAKYSRPDDLALVADVDEIARPHVIDTIAKCPPFPRGAGSHYQNGGAGPRAEDLGLITLRSRHFRYGMHCDRGFDWHDGPKLYSAEWLLRSRARGDFTPTSFDSYRTVKGATSAMVQEGGWHLSSMGNTSELLRKLTTFGASNLFPSQRHLDPARIEACISSCSELVYKPGYRPTPCDNETDEAIAITRKARNPPKGAARRPLASLDLPPYLIEHHDEFPPSWFEQLKPSHRRADDDVSWARPAKSRRRGGGRQRAALAPTQAPPLDPRLHAAALASQLAQANAEIERLRSGGGAAAVGADADAARAMDAPRPRPRPMSPMDEALEKADREARARVQAGEASWGERRAPGDVA